MRNSRRSTRQWTTTRGDLASQLVWHTQTIKITIIIAESHQLICYSLIAKRRSVRQRHPKERRSSMAIEEPKLLHQKRRPLSKHTHVVCCTRWIEFHPSSRGCGRRIWITADSLRPTTRASITGSLGLSGRPSQVWW